MATILITGASGFIGQSLAQHFIDQGHSVVGISRSAPKTKEIIHIEGALGQSISNTLSIHQPTLVIHAANSTSKNQFEENTKGTLKWMQEIEKLSIQPIQVYLGSVSGNENNTSEYGRSKLHVEKEFIKNNHVVIKLGLVIGNGGFFKKIAELVKRKKLLPLLDGGNDAIYWTDLQWVKQATNNLLDLPPNKINGKLFNLVSKNPTSLKEIVKIADIFYKKHTVVFSVPSSLLFLFCKTLEVLNVNFLPFSSGSILSSRKNAKNNWKSDLDELHIAETNLKETIIHSL